MMVKICGITNPEDAMAAVEAGASALGFIFHPKSPRSVAPSELARWVQRIPQDVTKVGVFVNQAPRVVEAICSELGLGVAQLHGDETPCQHPHGVAVWKAFRVTGTSEPDGEYPADAILLDGPGSGQAFDWSISEKIVRPLIVAGGLDENNVRAAIARTRPWGVDVASGVESSPGRKDHARMKRFIKAALES